MAQGRIPVMVRGWAVFTRYSPSGPWHLSVSCDEFRHHEFRPDPPPEHYGWKLYRVEIPVPGEFRPVRLALDLGEPVAVEPQR